MQFVKRFHLDEQPYKINCSLPLFEIFTQKIQRHENYNVIKYATSVQLLFLAKDFSLKSFMNFETQSNSNCWECEHQYTDTLYFTVAQQNMSIRWVLFFNLLYTLLNRMECQILTE